jgi:DNA invertase Pin-like site-specific DNA recombinase
VIVDGYVRVSQVNDRAGGRFISPVVQRDAIEGWARLHGAVVGEVFEEFDESGARTDRPLLERAIARVENGESNGIAVSKLDRFGRSLLDGFSGDRQDHARAAPSWRSRTASTSRPTPASWCCA